MALRSADSASRLILVSSSDQVPEIEARELAARIARGDSIALLDVREPEEKEIVTLENSLLIPLMQLPENGEELRQLAHSVSELVVYCRSGARSHMAVEWLRAQGIENVSNLRGGILSYAQDVDPSMPTY